MNTSDRSGQGLYEVITRLLVGRDLDDFNNKVFRAEDDGAELSRVIVIAMRVLTGRHCPLGTRDMLHEEIKALRKSRNMTVSNYIFKLEDLVSLERWILVDDGNAMGEAEQCRHFSAGMPPDWQMHVVPQQACWTNLRDLQQRYLQIERIKSNKLEDGNLPANTTEIRPWVEIAVDIIGPFGPQRWWAMTIIDTSTMLVEIAAISDCSSAEAARIVNQWWYNRYPRPERCICSHGVEFRVEFQELLQGYAVQRLSTTKNPRANEVIDQVCRTIDDKLRSEQVFTRVEWEKCLSAVMFSFRDQHHMVMSPTPGQAAFGRDMLFDIPAKVSSRLQQEPKDTQAHRTNCQEDDERIFHEYGPDDLVLVAMSDRRTPNTQPYRECPQ
ncbi:hypothetical protein PC128_g385 [Phytophthora cactorum]|nr:hypothetical protein PC128_g385 [Phytophthora cactorum]